MVLPDVFVVHWNHEPTEWSKSELKPPREKLWRTYFATIAELSANIAEGYLIFLIFAHPKQEKN